MTHYGPSTPLPSAGSGQAGRGSQQLEPPAQTTTGAAVAAQQTNEMGLGDAEAGGEVAGGVGRGEPEITEVVEAVGVVGELDGFGGRDGEQGFEGIEVLLTIRAGAPPLAG